MRRSSNERLSKPVPDNHPQVQPFFPTPSLEPSRNVPGSVLSGRERLNQASSIHDGRTMFARKVYLAQQKAPTAMRGDSSGDACAAVQRSSGHPPFSIAQHHGWQKRTKKKKKTVSCLDGPASLRSLDREPAATAEPVPGAPHRLLYGYNNPR